MEIAGVIDSLGKIATREQLVARGFDGFDLTAAVRRGQIWRIRRAHYATRGAPSDAVTAVRIGGRLAGSSSARSYGLWAGFDDRIHVALPRNASRLRTNYAPSTWAHMTSDSSSHEVVLHWVNAERSGTDCWRVSAPETLRQMASWTDAETAIACLDTARKILGYTDRDIRIAFQTESVSERLLASRSRSGSDSGTESVVRQRLASSGVQVDQQVVIPGVGRVDMVVRGTRIVLEIDGKQFHSRQDAFENDRRRDATLASLGYVVIRLSFAQVFGRWPNCERAILYAIRRFSGTEISPN